MPRAYKRHATRRIVLTGAVATIAILAVLVSVDVARAARPTTDLVTELALADSGGPATARWTIEITNVGTAEAPGPIGIDGTVPRGVETVRIDGAGWSCSPPASTTLLRCRRDQGLAADEATTLTVVSALRSNAPGPNSAYVRAFSGAADATPADASARLALPVPVADEGRVTFQRTVAAVWLLAAILLAYTFLAPVRETTRGERELVVAGPALGPAPTARGARTR
ncbi:MAG: hypothetical protein S0880_33715 [Actinomycetota bacterium]|nr:hypothetical protein [Actinomycetota bacterium]